MPRQSKVSQRHSCNVQHQDAPLGHSPPSTTKKSEPISLAAIAERLPRELWINILEQSILETHPIHVLERDIGGQASPVRIPAIARLLESYRQLYLANNVFVIESRSAADEYVLRTWLNSIGLACVSRISSMVFRAKVFSVQGITDIDLLFDVKARPHQHDLHVNTHPGSAEYLNRFCASLGTPLSQLRKPQNYSIRLAVKAATGMIDRNTSNGRELTAETLVLALARFRIMLEVLQQDFIRVGKDDWIVPKAWIKRRV